MFERFLAHFFGVTFQFLQLKQIDLMLLNHDQGIVFKDFISTLFIVMHKKNSLFQSISPLDLNNSPFFVIFLLYDIHNVILLSIHYYIHIWLSSLCVSLEFEWT